VQLPQPGAQRAGAVPRRRRPHRRHPPAGRRPQRRGRHRRELRRPGHARRPGAAHHRSLHRRAGTRDRPGPVRHRARPVPRRLADQDHRPPRRPRGGPVGVPGVRAGVPRARDPVDALPAPRHRRRRCRGTELLQPRQARLQHRRRGGGPGLRHRHLGGPGQRRRLLGGLRPGPADDRGHADPGGDRAGQGDAHGEVRHPRRRGRLRPPPHGLTAGEREAPRHRPPHRPPPTHRRAGV
ncbi:MAG: hypothetical protein AVDCRST_MAG20-449, partial [uncultured Acidimicrobiales bacterium]